VTHQPTPNPHPVLDHPTGAVIICFQIPRLKDAIGFKNAQKFHFQNQSSSR
jgi:hypothetical protein